MDQVQSPRMEALTLQPLIRAFSTVEPIAEQRVANTGHVNTYLVSPTRFKAALDVRISSVLRQQLPMRDGGF